MEDASLVALLWRDAGGLDARALLQILLDAHTEIGVLLAQIGKAD